MARTWLHVCAMTTLVCMSVAEVLGISSLSPANLEAGHQVTSHGLSLQDLSLPPEVITEVLFSQVDVIQDDLEQCEEKVRNLLKEEEENADVNSTTENPNDIALEAFGNISENDSDQEDADYKDLEEDYLDENNENGEENAEEEDKGDVDDVGFAGKRSKNGVDLTTADRIVEASTLASSATVQPEDRSEHENAPAAISIRKRRDVIFKRKSSLNDVINGAFNRERRSAAYKQAKNIEESLKTVLEVNAGVHSKEIPVSPTLSKQQLLRWSRVGAEPHRSKRSPALTASLFPKAGNSVFSRHGDKPLNEIFPARSLAPEKLDAKLWSEESATEAISERESKQQIGRTRRSLEQHHSQDPERFVPLIGQLVDRLKYLKHSLEVCHALLTFGRESKKKRYH